MSWSFPLWSATRCGYCDIRAAAVQLTIQKVVALIDIDSNVQKTFTEEDQRGVEEIAQVMASECDWDQLMQ